MIGIYFKCNIYHIKLNSFINNMKKSLWFIVFQIKIFAVKIESVYLKFLYENKLGLEFNYSYEVIKYLFKNAMLYKWL